MTKKNVKSTFSKEDLKRIKNLIKEVDENIAKFKKEIMTKEKENFIKLQKLWCYFNR